MFRQHIVAISTPAALLLCTLYGFMCSTKASTPIKAESGFAVVELFTSEGCSSCPAADANVARLLAKKTENVFVLGFHVDYWNRLGWTDAYSQSAFSDRQRNYAAAFHLQSIYTPQVVVNGTAQFVGSNERQLTASVENSLHQPPSPAFHLQAERSGNNFTVSFDPPQSNTHLNLALIQPEAVTEVKKGENRGLTLHHVNVVRAFHTADTGEKSFTFALPKELARSSLQVIAYTQLKTTFQVTAVQQIKL